jgi:lauroyl/myristoyl acyltransferase
MQQAATAYLERLHDMIKAHPEQWHHFGEFLRRDSSSPGQPGPS